MAALTKEQALDLAVKELQRFLPVIEAAEKDPEVWALLTQGTGIATANGYRNAISRAQGALAFTPCKDLAGSEPPKCTCGRAKGAHKHLSLNCPIGRGAFCSFYEDRFYTPSVPQRRRKPKVPKDGEDSQ